ncbi:SLIT and NTRK-like protein 5 isoform X2 [Betta splendens]|uniref:SLIT and NTRK-like protein 5 isoform X2 n=1 Tax=Betta splendens TaxID=158456 RepID=A0A8M1HHZ4_BETSP|nr:SLIT and NTRK-like protein 5 isoform X2 [Betta splendens]
MAEASLTVVAAAALLLLNVQLSRSCDEEGPVLICTSLPPYFRPGYSTLMMYLRDAGDINATVFGSSNLSSVSRLVMNSAGVTAIADGAFGSLRGLTRLSLNDNALKRVSPRWFGRPDVLTELNLTGNRVEAVDESMLAGLNLTKLSLNNNRIAAVAPDTFSSLACLAELDLSDNRLTRLSPQVFGSARVRLHRNPWDCTCEAEDSVAFLTELWSRSLLDAQMEVTCESPPPLRGKPVWSVSVCGTQTHTFSTAPASGGTAAAPLAAASPTRPESETKTSVGPKPTDTVTTVTVKTTTDATPSPLTTSGTRTSVQTKPSDNSSQTQVTEPSSHPCCTLVVVMAILCALLSVLVLLVALHRRKRSSKAVLPGRPHGDRKEAEEGGAGPLQLPGHSEATGPFTGPRAKSAGAVLLRACVCPSGKDHVGQKEPEARDTDAGSPAEGKNLPVSEAGADPEARPEGLTDPEERADSGEETGENTETVPYLSIGTKPGDSSQLSSDGRGQRSLKGNVMGRISTWPPTAAQWQDRCKLEEEEEEEEGSDVCTVWTQNKMFKFSSEIEEMVNKVEPGSGCDWAQKEGGETEKNQATPPTKSKAPNRCSESSSVSEAHVDAAPEERTDEDAAAGRRTDGRRQRRVCRAADDPPNEPSVSSDEAERRRRAKGAAANPQRGGSTAPSAGATHQSAFMDLLHEVVQNNGRWTRERWRQIHVNRQRR